MNTQYVTKADLEEFKRILVEEMKNAEVQLKKTNGNKLLSPIYHRWIHNTSDRKPFDTPFQKMLPYKQTYNIWDAVRKVVCAVCGVTVVSAIPPSKQAMAMDFCDKLCEFIYNYMKNHEGDCNG